MFFQHPCKKSEKRSKSISLSLTDFSNPMMLGLSLRTSEIVALYLTQWTFFYHLSIKTNKHHDKQRKNLHLITIFVFAEPFGSGELLPLFVCGLFNVNRKTKHLNIKGFRNLRQGENRRDQSIAFTLRQQSILFLIALWLSCCLGLFNE